MKKNLLIVSILCLFISNDLIAQNFSGSWGYKIDGKYITLYGDKIENQNNSTSKITEPKNVAVAPKLMNTIENPIVNNIIGNTLILFFFKSSFNDAPEIYEIYPGIKGKTHGDKKLINPATKAKKNSIIFIQYFSWLQKFLQLKSLVHHQDIFYL